MRRTQAKKLPRIAAAALLLSLSPAGGALARTSSIDSAAPQAEVAQAPLAAPTGTVYVANETAGTISVIDAATNTITGTICLGSDPAIPGTPQPAGPCNAETDHHKPFYDGHVAPHGLWLTPDGSVLLVTNRISGTVVAIDTATNTILGYAPVGREPHLATVRPGGKEAWVAVRGESYIDVLELDKNTLRDSGLLPTERMSSIAHVKTLPATGPSMVTFASDGKSAFVAYGKSPYVHKIQADSRQIAATQTVSAPFTPFGLVTPDDKELYLVHKGAGTLSILRTSDLGYVVRDLPIGPRANHVAFAGNFAYITVGGPAPSTLDPDPAGKIVVVDRTTHQIVRELTGLAWNGDPHGIWATPDGQRLYVGHERGNRVSVLDRAPSVAGVLVDPGETLIGSITDAVSLKQPIDVVIKP